MIRLIVTVVFALLAVVLPLAGDYLAGGTAELYARFPAVEAHARASFQWPAFFMYAVIILGVLAPIVWRIVSVAPVRARSGSARPFPWWGWAAVAFTAAAWLLAWTRFAWFAPLQPHTFTPLWLGYIIVVNALGFRRHGRCPMLDRPACFAALFPASAIFWWYFEYLNRFVGNWHYVGVESLDAFEYFVHASVSFSTVLPAVLSTKAWLSSFPRLQVALSDCWPVSAADSRAVAWTLLMLGATGFAALGAWPRSLYSMVWLAPALTLLPLQALDGRPNLLTDIARGDWRGAGLAALAALACGLFWEMWNQYSLAHWEYSIPLVHGFLLFQMPLLGYAGYLPFGIVCIAVADFVYAPDRAGPTGTGVK